MLGLRFCILFTLIVQDNYIRAQDEFAADLFGLYSGVEQQLQFLRGSVSQMQADIGNLNDELTRILQGQQSDGDYDSVQIAKIQETQLRRAQDIAALMNTRDLWQRNFRVVNTTFTNIRKKVAI